MTDIEPYKKKELDSESGEERGRLFQNEYPSGFERYLNGIFIGSNPTTMSLYTTWETKSENPVKEYEKLLHLDTKFKKAVAVGAALAPLGAYALTGSLPIAFGYGALNWLTYKVTKYLGSKPSEKQIGNNLETRLLPEETK